MKELEINFTGRGEVRGFEFHQVYKDMFGYIYQVNTPFGSTHYEVFERKVNSRYNTVTYPSSKAFGRYAFTFKTITSAMNKLNELKNEQNERNKHKGLS